jgi:anti-sigma regulatory factor (Ser/Thr protein kinase)
VADNWPLRTYLELGALPSAVACGRLHAKQVLWEWGLEALSETMELIVSELLTNAIQATADYERWQEISGKPQHPMPVRMRLVSDRQRVVVEVWDSNPHQPKRAEVDTEAENGRGLLLVDALSSQWHWYFPNEWGGKVVWAEIRVG